MNIQAKTNEELRTKLSNLLQEKNSLWVQIEKLAAGLVIAKLDSSYKCNFLVKHIVWCFKIKSFSRTVI